MSNRSVSQVGDPKMKEVPTTITDHCKIFLDRFNNFSIILTPV